jgi:hypothetical protein
MKKTSPLGFRETAGPTIRIITSCVFIALVGYISYLTVTGVREGEMYLGSKYGHGSTYYRERNPKSFWFATAVNFSMCALLGGQSIRELRFTFKRINKKQNA